MYNNAPYGITPQELIFDYQRSEWNSSQYQVLTNHFNYLNQPFDMPQTACLPQKVLINPHFKTNSKVFVNPNFSGGASIHVNPRMKQEISCLSKAENALNNHIQSTKIHINPNAKNVQMPFMPQTVHINPKFTNIGADNVTSTASNVKENLPEKKLNKVIVLTKTKLIRSSHVPSNSPKLKRRNSVKSKYKIVKTGLSPKKSSVIGGNFNAIKSRFKLDNRKRKSLSTINRTKRYVYVNKFVSASDLAKSTIFKSYPMKTKSLNTINIGGITYRKSRNSIRRASISSLKGPINSSYLVNDKQNSRLTSPMATKIVKKFKIVRKQSPKKTKVAKLSPKILRKCNIPCPSFKKYGLCKGKINGKCIWKHDPDQIALCTRFLQGACIKEKCLLSHNVSPEKMPTCKYYLEGSCSRENCPYLHVKISPKAEVCRDFLEGFCKKAAECDKRHQYLCPDYEKYGNCVKQRCLYPHGNMVRTYLINKNKFAKKSSHTNMKSKEKPLGKPAELNEQQNDKQRYYVEKKLQSQGSIDQVDNETNLKHCVELRSRPKLGSLPAFIPFKDS